MRVGGRVCFASGRVRERDCVCVSVSVYVCECYFV